MKKFATCLALAFVASLVWASASFAAKAMTEDELEVVTAAGQPTVIAISATGAGGITAAGVQIASTTTNTLSILGGTGGTGAQQNLTALTLNNVVGENQVANGMNISAGSSTTTNQTNTAEQSWGSVVDTAVVQGASGAAGGTIGAACNGVQVLSSCTADASGGDGAPSLRQSIYADQIIAITLGGGAVGNVAGPVQVANVTTNTLTIAQGSQENLAALVVNNVAGSNQIANGTNIASNSVVVSAGGPVAINNATTVISTQSNSATQYRGAPIGYATR